jgi:hypothetical protein
MSSTWKAAARLDLHEGFFDGRTGFASLTYTQKLAWLSEAAASVYVLARCNPEAGCNGFFDPRPRKDDRLD